MLDQLSTATATTTAPAPFSERQARDYLQTVAGKRPSVRELAVAWGWSKSTVARFVSQLDRPAVGQHDCPSPQQLRSLLINGAEDFDRKHPAETAEGLVDRVIAEGKVGDAYWSIPSQAAIECAALPDGGVEIIQERGQRIEVAAGNAVQLARLILYAAGFNGIGIYTYEGGGCVDVEDGQLAANFEKA
jgi:hypothetical protein